MNLKSINEIEEEVISEFEILDTWMDKYEYIIELGKSLPLIDEKFKTDDYKVSGCQSQLWLKADKENDRLFFSADSDAIISKGLINLLIRVLSNQKPEDIANAKLEFIDKIGMKEHLSPNRANGLQAMIDQMKRFAEAYLSKNN
ncbi:MAG: SufE family protein [Ignavibacteria bacterium]|nr:SufE family protein [Bacteroidota bacterium]MBL7127836.1 SufE family protein [Ignavibacteria bacterium]